VRVEKSDGTAILSDRTMHYERNMNTYTEHNSGTHYDVVIVQERRETATFVIIVVIILTLYKYSIQPNLYCIRKQFSELFKSSTLLFQHR